MRVPSAKRIARHGQARASERARGAGRHILRFTAARAVETSIPNLARLPVQAGANKMQNAAGHFYFLSGYSDPAGGDIARP